MKNLINLTDLKNIVTLGEYQSNEVEKCVKLSEEVNTICGVGFCLPMFQISVQDGKTYFERAYCIIVHPALDLRISYEEYKKQYSISCYTHYRFCGSSCQGNIRKKSGLEVPNNIGVLTFKKVQQWITCYEQLHALYAQKAAENEARINEFRKELEQFELSRPGVIEEGKLFYYGQKEGKKMQGCIKKNGIEFMFEISEESGFVSKRMELRSASGEISDFLKLSDNGYSK